MAPTSQQAIPDNHNDTNTLQTIEQESLFTKVYATIVANKAIQTGLKQISLISQPLRTKFDYKLIRLTQQMKRLISRDNIYNRLTNIWLSHALPYTGTVVSFETLAQEYKLIFKKAKRQHNPKTLNIFYQFACESWKTLNQPSTEDVKNTMIKIVSRTVNKAYHFEDETLSEALYNVFNTLIEKRGELVSSESFVKLVKTALGEEFINRNYQTVNAPSEQFYVFAKRFVVLDLPLATGNNDVINIIKNFIQDNSFFVGDSALDFVEKKIDFISEFVGQKEGEFVKDNTIVEKARRILKKAASLSAYPLKKIEGTFHYVQATKYYTYLDSRIQFNKRIDNAILLSAMGYNMLRENILKPSINTFQLVQNKTKAQVTVIIHNLDVQAVKKNYAQLHAKYEVLQKCAVIIAGETVKLVFDKKALAELGAKGKKELFRAYHELKTLETQKIVELSLEYYAAILKKAKTTYGVACQSVDSQKNQVHQEEQSEAKPIENNEVTVVREEQNNEKPVANDEVKLVDNSETTEVREEQSDEKPVENADSEKREGDSPSTMVGEKEASGSSEEENH